MWNIAHNLEQWIVIYILSFKLDFNNNQNWYFRKNYKLWSVWEVNKSSWQIMICMQNSYYYMLHLVKRALYNVLQWSREKMRHWTYLDIKCSNLLVNINKWHWWDKSLGTFSYRHILCLGMDTIQNFDSTH